MKILGVNVTPVSKRQFLDLLQKKWRQKQKYLIGYANIHGLNTATEMPSFKAFYNKCDLVTCDGIGILLGAKLLGEKVNFKQRITAPDYLDELFQNLTKENKSIYFVSSTPEVIDKLKVILDIKHCNLRYMAHHGYFNKVGIESEQVIREINSFSPDILLVGFGMPMQENWIMDNFGKFTNCIILPLGACLDFYTNTTYRGPKFMTENGLEWVSRLLIEPKRLWKRYLIGNPTFLYRILIQVFRKCLSLIRIV